MKLIPTTEISAGTGLTVANPEKPHIAYLLSQYPAISHTFFLKEVLSLKQLGFQIETCSINSPDRPHELLTAAEQGEANNTYYIQGGNKWGRVSTLLSVLLRHPNVCLRGIHAAVKLGTWDIYRLFYRFLYLAEALLLGAWMQRRKVHHLHVHFGGPVATVGYLTAQAWGGTYSLTIHGPEEFYDVEQFYLVEKFKEADFIFCISNFCRSQVMKYSPPLQWKNFDVVPLGVDSQHFHPEPRTSSDPLLQIISVGRLVPAKGQLILLSSLRQLLKEEHQIHLTFVGDGSDRKLLETFVIENHLSGSVTFLGALNHDQTRAKLGLADIFVLPSFAEGVPVALMEAMAMEIPCVSTQIAGIPELIENEVEGLLVPASSEEALTGALERLIESPELRRQLGSAGRKKVLNCYDLTKNIDKLAAAFQKRLATRRA
jgi:colanic acid/amylovoran biosynthesis glycosyltransferase